MEYVRTSCVPGMREEDIGLYKPKPLGYYNEEYGTSNPVVPRMLEAGLLDSGQGVLAVSYTHLRAHET